MSEKRAPLRLPFASTACAQLIPVHFSRATVVFVCILFLIHLATLFVVVVGQLLVLVLTRPVPVPARAVGSRGCRRQRVWVEWVELGRQPLAHLREVFGFLGVDRARGVVEQELIVVDVRGHPAAARELDDRPRLRRVEPVAEPHLVGVAHQLALRVLAHAEIEPPARGER